MGDVQFPDAVEPERWTLVFHRTARNWFFSLIALGHFKHVSAFTYLAGIRAWLVYDVQFSGTRLIVLPDCAESKAILGRIIDGNATITMTRRAGAVRFWRVGFSCTAAVKHLLGLRTGALRPDALWRHCVAQGGVIADHGFHTSAAASPADSARSEPCSRTAGGDAGQDRRAADAIAG